VVLWNVRDNVYVMQQLDMSNDELTFKDWSHTIFVSPLYDKMTAFSLAMIMSNVFGQFQWLKFILINIDIQQIIK
jgi:hypothetical protein